MTRRPPRLATELDRRAEALVAAAVALGALGPRLAAATEAHRALARARLYQARMAVAANVRALGHLLAEPGAPPGGG